MRDQGMTMMGRRTVLGGLAATPLAGCVSVRSSSNAAWEITSPAPPTNPLHKLNLQLLKVIASDPTLPVPEMPAVALPESINKLAEFSAADRSRSLPIITAVDFGPARIGGGPAWHGYDRRNSDLGFVSSLYDIGFGIHLFDNSAGAPSVESLRGKRIAAPPRPSAVRMMTEALLRDGWDILDDVTLVDMVPPQIAAAREAGAIDGTSWNLALPKPGGMAAMMGAPSAPVGYVPVSAEAMEAFNAANDFSSALAPLVDGEPPLILFSQGLAAWDDTDLAVVRGILQALRGTGARFTGYPDNTTAMMRWPGLTPDMLHPVAREFYGAA